MQYGQEVNEYPRISSQKTPEKGAFLSKKSSDLSLWDTNKAGHQHMLEEHD